MAKTLTPRSPLDGLDLTIGDVHFAEVPGQSIVALAVPLKGESKLATAVKKAWSLALPETGMSTANDQVVLLGLQQDQYFLLAPETADPETFAEEALGKTAFITDQTDAWAVARLSGAATCSALERICMLDLGMDAFPVGKVARTSLEHVNAILLREAEDSFLLLSPRSSAGSFSHAVSVSMENIA